MRLNNYCHAWQNTDNNSHPHIIQTKRGKHRKILGWLFTRGVPQAVASGILYERVVSLNIYPLTASFRPSWHCSQKKFSDERQS